VELPLAPRASSSTRSRPRPPPQKTPRRPARVRGPRPSQRVRRCSGKSRSGTARSLGPEAVGRL